MSSLALTDVNLQDGCDGGRQIIGFGCLCVVNLHGKGASGDVENGRLVKVLGKLLCIHCGGGDEQLEVGSEACNVLDQTKQDIRVQRALVCFVDHEHTV